MSRNRTIRTLVPSKTAISYLKQQFKKRLGYSSWSLGDMIETKKRFEVNDSNWDEYPEEKAFIIPILETLLGDGSDETPF